MPSQTTVNPNVGGFSGARGPSTITSAPSMVSTQPVVNVNVGGAKEAPQPQMQATQGFSNPNATTFVGDPNAPQPTTGFTVPPQEGPITSEQMTGGTTFKDLVAKRDEQQRKFAEQYAANEALKAQNYADQFKARQAGDTTDFGTGMEAFVARQNDLKQLLSSTQLAAQKVPLDFATQNISTFLSGQQDTRANAPEFSNFTTNPQGDVYGTVRDPRSGATSIQAFGNIYNGTFNQANPQPAGGAQNGGALSPLGNGMFRTPDGGTVNQTYAQKISSLPAQYQQFVNAGPEGVAYINSSRLSQLPAGAQQDIQRKAAAAGIPWLDEEQSAGLQSVYGLYDTLGLMQSLIEETLSAGVVGKVKGGVKAKMQDVFGVYPQLQNFNNLRTLAGQADTNLMGGIGSGFRQNTANLGLSVQNLPTSTDNLETAKVKIAATRALLDQSMLKTFPNFEGTGSLMTGATKGATSGSVIQTKVGAVDNSWF